MTLSAIVAVDRKHAIGKDNKLPWHMPEDLKFFKRTTMGKPVLMGRKTFESLGKPLPGRLNIVLSTRQDLELPEGVKLCDTLHDGISEMEQAGAEEGFIIGGGQIFTEALPLLDRVYITHVDTEVKGADAFFPEIDHAYWKISWEEAQPADDKHAFAFTFQQLERIAL